MNRFPREAFTPRVTRLRLYAKWVCHRDDGTPISDRWRLAQGIAQGSQCCHRMRCSNPNNGLRLSDQSVWGLSLFGGDRRGSESSDETGQDLPHGRSSQAAVEQRDLTSHASLLVGRSH